MSGTLYVGSGGDRAWNTATSGQGLLLVIGTGRPGAAATVLDGGNNIPNNTNIVVNSTGTFNATAADALGGFQFNGGTATIAARSGRRATSTSAAAPSRWGRTPSTSAARSRRCR